MVARFAELLANPPHDQLPTDDVAADLFRRLVLGVEEDRQRLVTAISGTVRAGNLNPVPDPAFDRQR